MYKLTSSLSQFPKTFFYLGAIKAVIYILAILKIFIIRIFKVFPFRSIIGKYIATTNAEEAEVEQFYEDLQVLLELTSRKEVLFIRGDWNGKIESQEITGVTGKFGLGVQNEAEHSLREFCQENALVTANTRSQQHKR